jgi:hypothetical protein
MSDVWDGIADEFLHLYPRGRRLVAVAGADAERSRAAADALSAALESRGHAVQRAHTPDGADERLRADIITPFRASSESDLVLVTSGPAALVEQRSRGLWNFIVWQLAGEESPHTIANAIVDVTDSDRPSRRFADYCALPSSYGA